MSKRLYSLLFLIFVLNFSQLFGQTAFNDTIRDSEKKLIVHVLGHSSVFIEYDTLNVYVDPNSNFHDFTDNPKADLIFITHQHSDHFDTSAIRKIDQSTTLMVYTHTCDSINTYSGIGTVMANGDSINIIGLPVKAVPAYNPVKTKHPKGVGNGYVIKFGNKRIYFSGDTEEVPEMTDIKEIDIAFLPLSQPYNMTPEMMVETAVMINPKTLIPYHYDNTDPSTLLTLMSVHPEIEVLTGQQSVQNKKFNNDELKVSTLYPNPAENFIYIVNVKNNSEIRIFEINGKEVNSKHVLYNGRVNISDLSTGYYLLQTNSVNEFRTFKLLKH